MGRKSKIILFVALFAVIVTGVLFVAFRGEDSTNTAFNIEDFNTSVFVEEADENGDKKAYIKSVEQGKVWEMTTNLDMAEEVFRESVVLYDYNQKEIEYKLNKKSSDDGVSFEILPPDGGYEEGRTYGLVVKSGVNFIDDSFDGVSHLDFSIKRDAIEKVTLVENVVKVDKDKVEVINDSEIKVSDSKEFSQGEIVYIEKGASNGVTDIAYKVTGYEQAEDGYILKVEEPELWEVYERIQISGVYGLTDESRVKINEDYLISQIEKSDFISELEEILFSSNSVYADKISGSPEISIKKKKTDKGTFGAEIEIKYKGVKDSKFDISLKLEFVYEPKFDCNVDVNYGLDVDYDIAFIGNLTLEPSATFTSIGGGEKEKIKVEELFAKAGDPKYIFKEIKENAIEADIPIWGPFSITAELDFILRQEFVGGLKVGFKNNIYNITGVRNGKGDKVETYGDFELKGNCVDLAIKGDIKGRFGVEIKLGLDILDSSFIGLKVGFGLYARLSGEYDLLDKESMTNSTEYYCEAGNYLERDLSVEIKRLIKNDITLDWELGKPVENLFFERGTRRMVKRVKSSQKDIYMNDSGSITFPDIIVEYEDVLKRFHSEEKIPFDMLEISVPKDSGIIISDGKIVSKGMKDDEVKLIVSCSEVSGESYCEINVRRSDYDDIASEKDKPIEGRADNIGEVDFVVEASSILRENYQNKNIIHSPVNVADSDPGTAWVEAAEGDGINEWIAFRGNKMFDLNTIQISNGYAKNESTYLKNNRVTKLRIIASNGDEKQVVLEDGKLGLQSVDVGFKNIYGLRLIVEGVAKGSKFDDLCISTIRFDNTDLNIKLSEDNEDIVDEYATKSLSYVKVKHTNGDVVDVQLLGYNEQDAIIWVKEFNNIPMAQVGPTSKPLVTKDKNVIIGVEGVVYSLRGSDGAVNWKLPDNYGLIRVYEDSDGNLYLLPFSQYTLRCVSKNGGVKWTIEHMDGVHDIRDVVFEGNEIHIYYDGFDSPGHLVFDKNGKFLKASQ